MYPSRSNASRWASVMRTGAGTAGAATSVLIEVPLGFVVTSVRRYGPLRTLPLTEKIHRSSDVTTCRIWTIRGRFGPPSAHQRRQIRAEKRPQLGERAHTLRLHQARCD